MAIYKIGVVGGGTMGRDIANLIAQAGIPVAVIESNGELAQRALDAIFYKNDRAVDKGRLMPDKAEMVRNPKILSSSDSKENLKDADLVIEAVPEDLDVKREVFLALDKILPPHVIFASNTSSLSINEMAGFTRRPDKFIGMHFFNPALTMQLVEIVLGNKASDETLAVVEDLCRSLAKTSIRVKDCPGFLVNRLLMPYLNEAVWLLTETNLVPEEIDAEATKFGWPRGPFRLLDYLGIDMAQKVADILYKGFGERAKPAPLMNLLIEVGYLGYKSGVGFHIYDSDKKFDTLAEIINKGKFGWPELMRPVDGFRRMMCSMANEAFLCLEEEIVTADDIETGCQLGIGFPSDKKSVLHWADEVFGLGHLLDQLYKFQSEYGSRFKPSKLLEEYVATGKRLFK